MKIETLFISIALFLYNLNSYCQITDSIEVNTIQDSLHNNESLEEVVVSGTMKASSKLESPIPVEVYTSKFFKMNPNPSIFDALQHINGVRPQINCNVCNTGDIHINGLEGPYTMILIDGMPIVSGLSTVYGLNGIPQSLIDRIEVVKGPASTLYGSEAVGGLINIITKSPNNAPILNVDFFGTSWQEINIDIATKFNVSPIAQTLLGINYFSYQNPMDKNGDNFTDLTLQNRFSLFNKWSFIRKSGKTFSIAGRYVWEDRWGGEMQWQSKYKGTDQVYGETIRTNRWEILGTYELPIQEKIYLNMSANGHLQDSYYGTTSFLADQKVLFGQILWFKNLGQHDVLVGGTYRYTYFDDNTPITANPNNTLVNKPNITQLPGLFIQDEWKWNQQSTLLLGARYDKSNIHGNIFSPRINYKWSSANNKNILRLGMGNGFRVANVFTEDHAALTGARKVLFKDNLLPETSWNANINFIKKMYISDAYIIWDATAFYTYFDNKIIADYDTNPNEVIYDNLKGYAISKGVSLNAEITLPIGLKANIGTTIMDVSVVDNGSKYQQLFTERFTGTWSISYLWRRLSMNIDYTGNIYGPMRLPLLSELDPRPEYSPWWSIQNIQLTKIISKNLEVYGGVKNILNWTPNKGLPFLYARAHDPFDKNVIFDTNGKALVTPDNPYGLTFDPSYVYAPNQGRRFFLGVRLTIN